MKNIFYLFFFLTSCLSCQKEDPANFRIIDAATKEGVPNATVELHESVGGTIATAGTSVFRERTTTDDLGNYQFDYDVKDGTLFSISAGADRYWNSTANSYRNHKTLELDPEGYVRVEVRKMDTVEYAEISINTASVSLGNIQFTGNKIDTVFTDTYRGGKYLNFAWWITINNVREQNSGEDILFPPHDTTTFEIIF